MYLYVCYGLGDYSGILAETGELSPMSAQELFYRAQALWRLDRRNDACRLLLSNLEEQLCNVSLFTETRSFFTEWQVDAGYRTAYNRLATQANTSRTTLGALKGDQVEIKPIF